MDFKLATRRLSFALGKESPTILTALGVTGFVTTVVMAVTATPKALKLIWDVEDTMIDPKGRVVDLRDRPLTLDEKFAIVWKLYLPAALVGTVTIVCIIGSNSVNLRRNAALASLYSLTEATLKEYRTKVIESIGEKKEQKIRDDLAQDRLNRNPIEGNTVIMSGKGEVLFYDSLSGRYFKSDMETIRRIVNDFNSDIIQQISYKTLNDFYYDLGLEQTEMGRNMGWSIDNGLLVVNYSAKIATSGDPCIVLEYQIQPKFL